MSRISNVNILYGEDKGLIDQKIKNLSDNNEIKYLSSFKNSRRYLFSKGLINNDTYFLLKNDKDILNEDYKKLKELLKSNNTYLFLVYDNIDKRKKFFKQAKNDLIEVAHGKKTSLKKYLKENIKVSDSQANWIIEACNHDFNLINQEINKLRYLDEITDDKIKTLVIENPENKIFEHVNLLLAGDKKAIKLYEWLIELKESQIKMLSILYNTIRTKYIINSMSNRDNKEITNKTDLSYYQVKMTRGLKCKFSNKELEQLMIRIQKLETNMKTGKEDIKLGYEKLMYGMCK